MPLHLFARRLAGVPVGSTVVSDIPASAAHILRNWT